MIQSLSIAIKQVVYVDTLLTSFQQHFAKISHLLDFTTTKRIDERIKCQ